MFSAYIIGKRDIFTNISISNRFISVIAENERACIYEFFVLHEQIRDVKTRYTTNSSRNTIDKYRQHGRKYFARIPPFILCR